jgi:peptidoglycan/LPS O-acetylase OafA/YrhL
MHATPRLESHKLNAIESLRGVAALMVILYHMAELLKLPIPTHLEVIRSHFGLGVPLFFALSGFVLAFGYADRLNTLAAIKDFYSRRLFRIAPLFYSMLLLWLVVNYFVFHQGPKAKDVYLNVFFLFGLVPGKHESIVWAGWSVGIEMLFYALFPLIIAIVKSWRSAGILLIVSMLVSATVESALAGRNFGSFAYMNLVRHLPYFAAGLLAYRVWAAGNFKKSKALAMALMTIALTATVAVIASGVSLLELLYSLSLAWLGPNLWAPIFGMLLLAVSTGRFRLLETGLLRELGKVSFSLYLVHPMVMLVLIKLDFVATVSRWNVAVGVSFAVAATVVVGLVWAVSAVTYRFIERPGIALGRNVAKKHAMHGAGIPAQGR